MSFLRTNFIQHFSCKSSLVSLCLLLSACSSTFDATVNATHDETKDRSAQAQNQLRQPQNVVPLVTEDKTLRFTQKSIPFVRSTMLPSTIGNITLRVPGRHNLSTVADLISNATGMITVRDAIDNVQAVEKLVDLQNALFLRQISMNVEVLQVDLSLEHQSGIDWSYVSDSLAKSNNVISLSGAPMVNGTTSPSAFGFKFNNSAGVSTGQALFKVLEKFGRVSTAYSSVLTTVNRQSVPVGVVDAGADVNSVNVSSAPSSCSKNFGASPNTVRVANVMQPTLDELKQLNLLSTASSYEPLFITDNRVVYKDASNRNAFLPPGYAVLIQRVCVNNPNAAVDSVNYCASPSPGYYDLQTLVFSSQPYSDKAVKNGGVTNMLYTAYKAAGVDALLAADGISKTTDPNNGNADITRKYPLIPANSNGQTFLPNPLKVAGDVGLKNILAMRGGYSSSVRTSYLRPDGLTPMSGNLNMGNNDILGVNNITASGDIKTPNGTITASNFVATNQLTAREINTSSISSSGNIKGFNFLAENQIRANDRIFTGKEGDPNCAVTSDQHGGGYGDINSCRDMVAKGYVKGLAALQAGPSNDVGILLKNDGSIEGKTINVDTKKNVTNINNITQSGGIKSEGIIETTKDFITAATQQVQAGYFRFLNTVAEGAGCAADFANSLTLDSTNQNKLLRCNGTTWVSMLQKGETGAPGAQGVQGSQGAGYLENTITPKSVAFTFTGTSGDGNTNLKCAEWTRPGFSNFSVGDQRDDYQIRIDTYCSGDIWAVRYTRNDTGSGDISVEITSIKKNNGYGITVSDDDYFEVKMFGNNPAVAKTIKSKYPPYTTFFDPWYLTINRNFSWWLEKSSDGSTSWDLFASQVAEANDQKGVIGWSALSFNGPVDVDHDWFYYTDRDDHNTNLSCTNWTKPVITGFWGGTRWNADQYTSWCNNGYWYVKGTQAETDVKSGWVSYKINARYP